MHFNLLHNLIAVIIFALLWNKASCSKCPRTPNCKQNFDVAFYWQVVNFTWTDQSAYQESVSSHKYIATNNFISGVKSYKNKLYVTLPRNYPGTPVTVASLPLNSPIANPLLEPYPSWEMNVGESCLTLQNVYATEIDTQGVMWIIDGYRMNNLTSCPPKIVLLDINNGGKVLQVYNVPDELTPKHAGWLNDIVVDESGGGFAYITESSYQDPGIIIYSRKQNRAWKIRDPTMFAELRASGFSVEGVQINGLFNVDGIALAPARANELRLLYYTSLTGYDLHAIDVRILKNEAECKGNEWRKKVQYVGTKSSPSDGMVIDNTGNLYFGLIPQYAIGRWNIYKSPFRKYAQIVYQNYTTVIWPDSFGMDTSGNLYVSATEAERTLNSTYQPPPKDNIKFRILKTHTGTSSYLY